MDMDRRKNQEIVVFFGLMNCEGDIPDANEPQYIFFSIFVF